MYTSCCLVVIHPCAKIWYAYVKEPDSNSLWTYNFDIEIKDQGHECMRHIVPWWYTHVPNKAGLFQRKTWGLNTKSCHKPYKFDLEVKGQGRIRIMIVLNTSSDGDRPMCQIWYANVQANRSYTLDMKTWIWTGGQRSTSNRDHESTRRIVLCY